eukprot:403355865
MEPEENPLKNYSLDQLRGMGGNLGYQPEQLGIKQSLKSFGVKMIKKMGIHKMLGTALGIESSPDNQNTKKKLTTTLPSSYDYRTAHPGCTHAVLNQQSCGSCWSFAATSMLQDRLCLHSNGAVNVQLSQQDMVSCDFDNAGCSGGWLSHTINYLVVHGVVTSQCLAYASVDGAGRECSFRCDDANTEYKKYGCKFNSLKMTTSKEEMMEEIYLNGPVMVGFIVYSDFMSYGGGYYEVSPSASISGGHAVIVHGWGYNGGRLYWIAQNQWGTTWGSSGYFNIYEDQAGFDLVGISCIPDV